MKKKNICTTKQLWFHEREIEDKIRVFDSQIRDRLMISVKLIYVLSSFHMLF